MVKKGFLIVPRAPATNAAFRTELEISVFYSLLRRAAFTDGRVNIGGRVIDVKRGQIAISTRKLARDFEISDSRVRRLLIKMSDAPTDATSDAPIDAASPPLIKISSKPGINIITICNYDKIQCLQSYQSAPKNAEKMRSGDAAPTYQRRASDAVKELNEKNKQIHARAKSSPLIPATSADWRQLLGPPEWRSGRERLQNFWDEFHHGPSPWRRLNPKIPPEIYRDYATHWGWVQPEEEKCRSELH